MKPRTALGLALAAEAAAMALAGVLAEWSLLALLPVGALLAAGIWLVLPAILDTATEYLEDDE